MGSMVNSCSRWVGGGVFSGLKAVAFGVILGGGRAFVFFLSRVPNSPSKTGLDQLFWSKVKSSPMVEIDLQHDSENAYL